MATKLTKLRIKELSGVDEPANELAGWIVQKSKDGRDAEIQKFEKDVVGLYESLAGESTDLYLIDAPDEVLKARDDLIAHIGTGLEDDGEDEVEKAEEAEVEKGKTGGLVSRLRDVLSGDVEKGKKKDAEDAEDMADGGNDEEAEGEADGEEPEPDKKKMKKADDEAEVEKDAGDSSDDEDDDEKNVTKSGDEEEIEKAEGDEEAEPALNAEDLAKAFSDELNMQLEPIREAVVGLADRVENVEKASAGRASLDGQDFLDDFETDGEPESGMAKAIRGAVVHGKVELT